jgi:hypothetical protein
MLGEEEEEKPDIQTSEGLKQHALQEGLTPDEPNKFMSALRFVGGVLGTTGSFMAGTVHGFLDPEKSVFTEGFYAAKKSLIDKEPLFFADVMRERGIKPETRAGKIALGITGFAADIVLDPLTYITFGAARGASLSIGKGVKATVNKEFTEVFQRSARNLTLKGTDARKAKRQVQLMFEEAVGKKGLTQEAVERFLKLGLEKGDVEAVARAGKEILDKGGIKFFGKTLVSSAALAATPVGKAAKRLGQTKTIQSLKEDLGSLFVKDMTASPKFAEMVSRMNKQQREAMEKLLEKQDSIFRRMNEKQIIEFSEKLFENKATLPALVRSYEKNAIKQVNKYYPQLKVKSPADARKILNEIEEKTTGRLNQLQKEIDRLSAPLTKTMIRGIRDGTMDVTEEVKKISDLDGIILGLRDKLKDLKSKKGTILGLPSPTKTPAKIQDLFTDSQLKHNYLRNVEEKMGDTIEKLSRQIEKLIDSPQGVLKTPTPKKLPPASRAQVYEAFQREIFDLQNTIADQSALLGKVLDSRRLSKAALNGRKLTFKDPVLQEAANRLFENVDALVPRMARMAGIKEEEMIRYYIASRFKDRTRVVDYARGRNLSSPKLGFMNPYEGVQRKDLIKDPREAYRITAIEATTARMRSNTIRSVFRKMGKKEMSEQQAKRLNYEKISREVLHRDGGKEKITAWMPKEVIEEMNRFDLPSKDAFAELAKYTGFDYVTALFKGYVTSLFPGFHIRNLVSNQFQNMLMLGAAAFNPKNHIAALKIMGGIKPGQQIAKKLGRHLTEAEYSKVMAGKTPDKILKGWEGQIMTQGAARKIIEKDMAKETGYIVTKAGEKITFKHIRKEVEKHSDILKEGAYGPTNRHLDLEVAAGRGLSDYNPLNPNNKLMSKTREWGFMADSHAKMTAIVEEVKRGRTIKEAIQTAEMATFNYGKLTRFERNIMRRMIPFYIFGRKNAELQVRALAQTPGRTAAMFKTATGMSYSFGEPFTEGDKEGLPDFILNNLGMKAGAWAEVDGKAQFLSGFGLPIEEFLGRFSGKNSIPVNIIKTTLTQLNPVIKVPLEKATGQDFFRGRPIVELNDGAQLKDFISMLEAMPGPVAEDFKDLVQWSQQQVPIIKNDEVVGYETKYTANPFALHLTRNLFTSRFQNTLLFMNSEEQTRMAKLLRLFTGVRGWSIDQETQEWFRERDKKEHLMEYLERMGVVATFERSFIPKSEKEKEEKGLPELDKPEFLTID